MKPVPTMYSSKQTPQVRPPSLLYTSPESMKFIEKHDKDLAANFDKETSRQTRARSNAKLFQERERPHKQHRRKRSHQKRKNSTSKNV